MPAYGARFELLFGFLFLLAAGLFAVAVWRGPSTLHLAGGLATLVVFAVWAFRSYAPGAWPSILAFLALFVVFFLAAPFVAEKAGRPLDDVGLRAAYAAPLLLALAPVLVSEEPRAASPGLLFAVVFVLLALCAAYAIVREEGGVFFAGAFFALLAEAVWSAKHLTPERLLPGLALYGVFSLFYLGVPLAARRFGKSLKPGGLSVVLLFAALALLLFLAAGPVAASALWGLALLLAVLNVGLFAEGAAGRFPVATLAGVLLSWGVLAVWWMTVPLGSLLVPGLLVVLGFALVVVGGSAWVRSKTGAEEAGGPNGIHLGLVGHLFLLFVATQPALAVPPWPLLGILLVLDLALAAAAFATGVGALLAVALVLSQIVLLVLVGAAREAPWPTVTVVSTLVVAGLGLLGRALAPRSPKGGEALRLAVAQGAAAALLLGQGRDALRRHRSPGGPASRSSSPPTSSSPVRSSSSRRSRGGTASRSSPSASRSSPSSSGATRARRARTGPFPASSSRVFSGSSSSRSRRWPPGARPPRAPRGSRRSSRAPHSSFSAGRASPRRGGTASSQSCRSASPRPWRFSSWRSCASRRPRRATSGASPSWRERRSRS